MVATITKLGNSLTVRIPPNLAKQIHLSEGSEVSIQVVDGSLVIKPRNRKRYSLEELVQGINSDNLHAEVDTQSVVGNEVW